MSGGTDLVGEFDLRTGNMGGAALPNAVSAASNRASWRAASPIPMACSGSHHSINAIQTGKGTGPAGRSIR
jgi:hypothetical protein